jgi:hypothetical protein
MKYKAFLSLVKQVYSDAEDKILTTSKGYWRDTKNKSFITELVHHWYKDFDLEELKEESKHVEEVFNSLTKQLEVYNVAIYATKSYILDTPYYTTKKTLTKLSNIRDEFVEYRDSFIKIISCNRSMLDDHIPANNWRLCKIFKVKPATKINPKLVIPDEYIDKIAATYFDLIRHGLITNED